MKNRSAPPGAITPRLVYKDLGQAIEWLCRTFGFTERYRYGREDTVEGALLAVGDGSVMLAAPRTGYGSTDRFEFRPPRPNEASHSIHVHTDNVDRHHAHATECGARILLPPETYFFGERQYTAVDLAGHIWTFSEAVSDVAPEDWGAALPGA